MPNELRRLLFNQNEVLQAIMDMNTRSNNRYFPDGHISNVKIVEDPSPHVDLVVEVSHNKEDEGTIDTPTLGASLIGFCIRKKIPLPAKANKSLKVVKGQLVIDIKII